MWNFFDNIVCMNLDKRKDRWGFMSAQFAELGIPAKRFAAITGENRFLAYNDTYHGILSHMADNGGNGLVLEDDVKFKSIGHLDEAISQLPVDWDVLYLGANLNGTKQEKFSSCLYKIRNSLTSHAIAYSEKMIKYIVEHFNPNEFPVYDEWMRVNIQEKFNCFVIKPMIAWQTPGYSDLWEVHADYTPCFRDGELLLQ